MSFRIGDRVVCVKKYGNVEVGETGTYVDKEISYPEHGVAWDKANQRRHSCGGHCESKHGWYVPISNIRLAEPPDLGDFSSSINLGLLDSLLGG